MISIGEKLRRERELRHISIEEVALITRIPRRTLLSIEQGRSDELPGEVFVRGFVKSYARALGLDAARLLDGLGSDGSDPQLSSSIPAIPSDERGRRFGITIALVILVILFTLALSIVLRPRRRHAPIQLSQRSSCPVPSPSSVRRSSSAPSISAIGTASSRC
ncbi:MAG: helix-turn-helix domain-containing protein [Myxococcales bacterium]|nr:helix-turn-helix domain-containing protein [Myxococcales bacterium]